MMILLFTYNIIIHIWFGFDGVLPETGDLMNVKWWLICHFK